MSESKIELERNYTVPLSRAWIAPRHRRTSRAVNILREFAAHHMKAEEIKIDSKLNEKLWSQGITHPPRRIAVRMTKDEEGLVTILLPKALSQPSEEATPSEAVESNEELSSQKDDAIAQTVEAEKSTDKTEPQRTMAEKKTKKKSKSNKEKKVSPKKGREAK